MEKSAEAFRTISEVADWLGVPTHVLRFWESRFPQVKPVKRAGGRRYYRPADMSLLAGIRVLLHDQGMTIRGVQKLLREQGIKHVAAMCDRDLGAEPTTPPPPADPVPEPPAQDETIVELASTAFAAEAEPAPAPQPDTPAEEPLPLFASGRTPAAPAQTSPAPSPTPVAAAPAAAAPPRAPEPPQAPAPVKVTLPGASPTGTGGLREMRRALRATPDALATLSPETAQDLHKRLEDLRARLAGSDSA